ncbi:MAG: efflux RND transporter periplasmic adaptor subunit [Bacteroidetes bacterium]|nr:MAG: efflux RND transporter periplasmic adaptor subunit [Bacteroidota bacterium]
MKTKFSKRDLIIIAAALIIGLTIGKFALGTSEENHDGHDHELEQITENGEIIWTCSMHPQIRMDEPGNCPICGMELIPADDGGSDEEASDPNEIQMSESAMKLADVQTVMVKRGMPDKSLFLLGKVKADERNIAQLTARFGGRIEKLFVNYKGQNVRKGEKLATIYSPDLITAQRELLEASKYKKDNPQFYTAARGKLKLWDLTDKQIDDIENNGEPKIYFDILSPISGTVTRRDVAIGDYVKEGMSLLEVTDLTKVWVMFDAYESDLPWIKKGDMINFTMQSLPGKTYSGKVTYIDPFIDASTRVAQVRVEMNNPNLKFKPEMFANGILESKIAEQSNALLIPKSSILWTGKRAVVYVKIPSRKKSSFLYREIVLGPEAGNFYVVSSGLMEGEEIATNGVFKIDASAQLAGKPSMMNPSADGGKVNTMPGMDMGPSTSSTSTSSAESEGMTDEEMKNMDSKKTVKEEKSDMKCEAGKCGSE